MLSEIQEVKDPILRNETALKSETRFSAAIVSEEKPAYEEQRCLRHVLVAIMEGGFHDGP